MSELLKIMEAEKKRKLAISDKMRLVERRLNDELDSWRRARLARMTKADWICEYRYWQTKLAARSENKAADQRPSAWAKLTIAEFLEKTHQEWDPLLATSQKNTIKSMVRTLMDYCGVFTGAPDVDDRYFE